jgi:hypothetical protein
MIEQWNYPVKTKAIHCDIWIGFICFFISGVIIGSAFTSIELLPLEHLLSGVAFGVAMCFVGFYNFHYWTFKQMKAYENRYGKTGLGDDFKNNWESKNNIIEKIFMNKQKNKIFSSRNLLDIHYLL